MGSSRRKIMSFGDASVGTKFRWLGGITIFIKTGENAACVDGQPNKNCNPSDHEKIVFVGWTNLCSG